MPSRFGKILAVLSFAVTVGSASVSAQECVIPASDLIGIQMGDGTCFGATKTLAKMLKIDVSQCKPLPKKGEMILGSCVPQVASAGPAPPYEGAQSTEQRIQALTEVVRELKSEIDALRTDMSVQNHETASEFEYIYSRIGR